MIDTANIMFLIVFIILPIIFGVWALLTRRELLRHRFSSRRRMISPVPPDEQSLESQSAPRPHIEIPGQETVQVPAFDQPDATAYQRLPVQRRRFLVPRYNARSGGVVKRLGPLGVPDFTRANQPRSNAR
jgi:hypothetical protein